MVSVSLALGVPAWQQARRGAASSWTCQPRRAVHCSAASLTAQAVATGGLYLPPLALQAAQMGVLMRLQDVMLHPAAAAGPGPDLHELLQGCGADRLDALVRQEPEGRRLRLVRRPAGLHHSCTRPALSACSLS